MKYDLTEERNTYLNARGKIVLNACPGSGKTTSIVKKLKIILDENPEIQKKYAGVACLSFTNVAKDELMRKFSEMHGFSLPSPSIVSTIDHFINRYITLPYINLLDNTVERPRIIDDPGLIDRSLTIRYRDKTGKEREKIRSPFNLYRNYKNQELSRSYPPSKITREKGGLFTFSGKKPNPQIVSPQTFQEYGKDLFRWKLKAGVLTCQDSAYTALKILERYPQIGRCLALRFPHIIIDEAQDTSDIQHAIFEKLVLSGLQNIEFVGDPYQSLYEWRDARPELFIEKMRDPEWRHLDLVNNRRSNQRIIDFYSKLRLERDENNVAFGVTDLNIPILVYRYNKVNTQRIVMDFENACTTHSFQDVQIVVRGITSKNRLNGIKDEIKPWVSDFPSRLLNCTMLLKESRLKEAVSELRHFLVYTSKRDLDYSQLKIIEEELIFDSHFNFHLLTLLKYSAAIYDTSTIETWSIQCSEAIVTLFQIDLTDQFLLKKRMKGFTMKTLIKERISHYFSPAVTADKNFMITTVHQVKGKSLDAILFFLDGSNTGQGISIKNFQRPVKFPKEKVRIIYTACSRPRQLLALAVPNNLTDANLYKFLGKGIFIRDIS